MICRHSSEPIEPPAPVTSTHLPRMHEPNSCGLRRHRIAAQQIADVDVAQLVDLRLAGDQVRQVRQRLDVHAERLERVRISRRRRREADGMASRIRSIRRVRTSSRQRVRAVHGRPLMLLPCSDFLSSMNATGSKSGPPSSTERQPRAGIAGPIDRHPGGRLAVRRVRAGTGSAPRSGCRRRTAAPAPSRCRTPTAGSGDWRRSDQRPPAPGPTG